VVVRRVLRIGLDIIVVGVVWIGHIANVTDAVLEPEVILIYQWWMLAPALLAATRDEVELRWVKTG